MCSLNPSDLPSPNFAPLPSFSFRSDLWPGLPRLSHGHHLFQLWERSESQVQVISSMDNTWGAAVGAHFGQYHRDVVGAQGSTMLTLPLGLCRHQQPNQVIEELSLKCSSRSSNQPSMKPLRLGNLDLNHLLSCQTAVVWKAWHIPLAIPRWVKVPDWGVGLNCTLSLLLCNCLGSCRWTQSWVSCSPDHPQCPLLML